jgi:NhaP-type Na+/H+ or K+/H+ antiporter
MWKILGGVVVGVFVGAVAVEIINRVRPNLLTDVRERAARTTRAAIDAFHEGYQRKPKKLVPVTEKPK